MPYNGSGTFTRAIASWVNDRLNGIDITDSRFDSEDNDFASGLSNAICRDGQSITSAKISFSSGIGLNVGSASTPSFSITGDASTGFYQNASGGVSFASVGSQILDFTSSGIVLHGSASGTATLGVKATAGSVTFTLPTTNGTNGQLLQTDGSGNASWANVSSGSGTVNSGTAQQVAYYASSTNAVSGSANMTITAGALTLGVSGTAGSVKMGNATSGTVTLQPVTGALGSVTVSLPAATDTLVGKATTDTLTNKTYDTAGTGNTFKINGTSITAISGNTAKVATTTGSLTSGHIATFDASGNIQDGGSTASLILMTPLGVGSIIWSGQTTGGAIAAGATTAAANLNGPYVVNTSTGVAGSTGDSLTGTWKALQSFGTSASQAGLWQRSA